jgi:AbiV family abortive infection protein
MVQRKQNGYKQYAGELDIHQAASAMQAARLNSVDLLDTADILFNLKRFAHSVPFSILAIEESGKLVILQAILLGLADRAKLWRSYRLHRSKTENLNVGIMGRVRATFPAISLDEAREIAARGPTPEDLETAKQRAVYSDCIDDSGGVVCHLPRNVDWRQEAWERLCEARAIVLAPRDRSPDELDVWVRHVAAGRDSGKSIAAILPDIHNELVEKGFVDQGWWDTLLEDIETQTRGV